MRAGAEAVLGEQIARARKQAELEQVAPRDAAGDQLLAVAPGVASQPAPPILEQMHEFPPETVEWIVVAGAGEAPGVNTLFTPGGLPYLPPRAGDGHDAKTKSVASTLAMFTLASTMLSAP